MESNSDKFGQEVEDDCEPDCYYWFMQDDWMDGNTPNESLNFPDGFDLYDFEKWVDKKYPDIISCVFGTDEHSDACWSTFDPKLGYDGFQKIIDEYFYEITSE
jgi:hypothetical protein